VVLYLYRGTMHCDWRGYGYGTCTGIMPHTRPLQGERHNCPFELGARAVTRASIISPDPFVGLATHTILYIVQYQSRGS